MKKFFVYAFAALMMGGFVASCSDDDPEVEVPEPVVCPIEKTIFTGTDALKLTYSGESLLGKQAVFIPNEKESTKATLVLSGIVPESKAFNFNFPSAGVIPGESSTTLNLDLKIEGENVSFEGKDEKEGRIISYKGSASKEVLTLDLAVVMPESVLTNKKYAPIPYIAESFVDSIKGQSPITLTWMSEGKVPFFEDPNYDFNNFLTLAQMIAIVKVDATKKVCIGEALGMILKQVSFLPDGNIQAEYKDSLTDTSWKNSPLNMATYKVESANKVRVFINVDQILAFKQSQESRAGMAGLMEVLLKKASELLMEGIVVTFEEKDGQMQFFLDKEAVLPVLKLLVPFLKDEEFLKEMTDILKSMLGSDKEVIVDMMALPIIKAMPGVIEGTTEIHFGMNMSVAQ